MVKTIYRKNKVWGCKLFTSKLMNNFHHHCQDRVMSSKVSPCVARVFHAGFMLGVSLLCLGIVFLYTGGLFKSEICCSTSLIDSCVEINSSCEPVGESGCDFFRAFFFFCLYTLSSCISESDSPSRDFAVSRFKFCSRSLLMNLL